MNTSRSGRQTSRMLTEKQIVMISILIGLIITASLALVSGKTVGQALGGYLFVMKDTVVVAEQSASSAATANFDLTSVSWKDLTAIRAIVSAYEAKHPLEIGITEITKTLTDVDTAFLEQEKIYDDVVIAKQRINLTNQLLEKPLEKLRSILREATQHNAGQAGL